MTDIDIRTQGHAGRITLTRPKALNALTHQMSLEIEAALDAWRDDPAVALVVIDADEDKAFCVGGDIQKLYDTGRAGDLDYGRGFWRDEYRLNAKIAEYPKPYIAFLNGFTMGGGVGIGCHGSHRIVDETSQIAMPECSIGLVPDVGGSLLLARAPGHLGEYLGITGARMGPADAILAGFADSFVPGHHWPDLIATLCDTGDISSIAPASETPPQGALSTARPVIDTAFAGASLHDILQTLQHDDSPLARDALKKIARNSPLSMACTVEMIHRLRDPAADIRRALDLEYRFTYRAMEHGDFLEGIRARIIDKDNAPNWRHDLETLPASDVSRMLMPLDAAPLTDHKEG